MSLLDEIIENEDESILDFIKRKVKKKEEIKDRIPEGEEVKEELDQIEAKTHEEIVEEKSIEEEEIIPSKTKPKWMV